MATRFITISIEIMHDKNLTSSEKFILAEIQQLTCLDKGCIASNQHFAELVGISRVTVSRAINSLVLKGHIMAEIEPGSRNHVRKLSLIKMIAPPSQNDKTPLSKRYETKENKTINIQNAPTLEEISLYVKEKNLRVSAKDFFDYFEAGNWKDSKGNKVKSWKQKLLTWNNHTSKTQAPRRSEGLI